MALRRLAAEKAKHAYANLEAATHYMRALEAARHMDDVTDIERAALWSELGDAPVRSGISTRPWTHTVTRPG